MAVGAPLTDAEDVLRSGVPEKEPPPLPLSEAEGAPEGVSGHGEPLPLPLADPRIPVADATAVAVSPPAFEPEEEALGVSDDESVGGAVPVVAGHAVADGVGGGGAEAAPVAEGDSVLRKLPVSVGAEVGVALDESLGDAVAVAASPGEGDGEGRGECEGVAPSPPLSVGARLVVWEAVPPSLPLPVPLPLAIALRDTLGEALAELVTVALGVTLVLLKRLAVGAAEALPPPPDTEGEPEACEVTLPLREARAGEGVSDGAPGEGEGVLVGAPVPRGEREGEKERSAAGESESAAVAVGRGEAEAASTGEPVTPSRGLSVLDLVKIVVGEGRGLREVPPPLPERTPVAVRFADNEGDAELERAAEGEREGGALALAQASPVVVGDNEAPTLPVEAGENEGGVVGEDDAVSPEVRLNAALGDAPVVREVVGEPVALAPAERLAEPDVEGGATVGVGARAVPEGAGARVGEPVTEICALGEALMVVAADEEARVVEVSVGVALAQKDSAKDAVADTLELPLSVSGEVPENDEDAEGRELAEFAPPWDADTEGHLLSEAEGDAEAVAQPLTEGVGVPELQKERPRVTTVEGEREEDGLPPGREREARGDSEAQGLTEPDPLAESDLHAVEVGEMELEGAPGVGVGALDPLGDPPDPVALSDAAPLRERGGVPEPVAEGELVPEGSRVAVAHPDDDEDNVPFHSGEGDTVFVAEWEGLPVPVSVRAGVPLDDALRESRGEVVPDAEKLPQSVDDGVAHAEGVPVARNVPLSVPLWHALPEREAGKEGDMENVLQPDPDREGRELPVNNTELQLDAEGDSVGVAHAVPERVNAALPVKLEEPQPVADGDPDDVPQPLPVPLALPVMVAVCDAESGAVREDVPQREGREEGESEGGAVDDALPPRSPPTPPAVPLTVPVLQGDAVALALEVPHAVPVMVLLMLGKAVALTVPVPHTVPVGDAVEEAVSQGAAV